MNTGTTGGPLVIKYVITLTAECSLASLAVSTVGLLYGMEAGQHK